MIWRNTCIYNTCNKYEHSSLMVVVQRGYIPTDFNSIRQSYFSVTGTLLSYPGKPRGIQIKISYKHIKWSCNLKKTCPYFVLFYFFISLMGCISMLTFSFIFLSVLYLWRRKASVNERRHNAFSHRLRSCSAIERKWGLVGLLSNPLYLLYDSELELGNLIFRTYGQLLY